MKIEHIQNIFLFLIFRQHENGKETPLPNEVVDTPTSIFKITGKRIVDISFFIEQLKQMNSHGAFDCTFADMDIISEELQGFRSGLKFKCKQCNVTKVLWTGQPGADKNINQEAVIAIMSIGGGFSNMEEMFSGMDIPTMSQSTYNKEHSKVCDAWEIAALQSMEEAAAEEKRLAIERGDIDNEGVPYFAVVADGSWAKRSYRTNYSSLSGMVSLIFPKIYNATEKAKYLGLL